MATADQPRPAPSPSSRTRLLPLRAILVTGKGGVGKTTVAVSLARFIASQGKRVLVTEIGSEGQTTSALADALGVDKITDEPREIAPGLSLAALDPATGLSRFLRDVLPMKILADAAMRAGAVRRFFAAAPTFPEMGVLYRLLDLVRARRRDGSFEHETIVVDLPATGHALALAQIPGSLLRVIPTGPIAVAVKEGLALLTDPRLTGAVVVTLPETLPISEALELAAGIREHKIPLAQIFVNRVPFDPFDAEEHAIVARMLEERAPMLGARSLERIRRARAALDRIAEAVDVPVATLQDVWFDQSRQVADEVASLIALDAQPARSVEGRSR